MQKKLLFPMTTENRSCMGLEWGVGTGVLDLLLCNLTVTLRQTCQRKQRKGKIQTCTCKRKKNVPCRSANHYWQKKVLKYLIIT